MPIQPIADEDYESFLTEPEFAVVLFDAPWDVGPGRLIRPSFEQAAVAFAGRVRFGEVDIDEVALAKAVPIVNVPTVAYCRRGQLIAAMIGARQNVIARTQALLDGKPIGRGDGWG